MAGTETGSLEPARTQEESREARPTRGHLEKHPTRGRLIRELAACELSQKELAEKYRCSVPAISIFKRRHSSEIDQVRDNQADKYADVWVAQKVERLRAYQDKVQEMLDGSSPRHAEVLANLLKAVAEELGDLPARQQVNVNTTNVEYKVVGINPNDLM